jgi:hypothetical protein
VRPVALYVDGRDPPDLFTAARCEEGDVPAVRVPGNGDLVEVKRVEEREQVALTVHVAVRVAVLAQAVTAKSIATMRTPFSSEMKRHQ